MKKFILSIFRPQKRRGKILLATVLSAGLGLLGIQISPEIWYPKSLGPSDVSIDDLLYESTNQLINVRRDYKSNHVHIMVIPR